MRQVRFSLLVLASASPFLAGCVDNGPAEALSDAGAALDAPFDLWAGSPRQTILEVHADLQYAFDVLCTLGGGPLLERDGAGRVLGGAGNLEVMLRADATHPHLQLGYVVDDSPAAGETDQEGIVWLPRLDGTEANHEIEVSADAFETPDGPLLWAFYYRQSPDGNMCYTGVGTGKWDVVVEAVKADSAPT